jgi:hypothetical protein
MSVNLETILDWSGAWAVGTLLKEQLGFAWAAGLFEAGEGLLEEGFGLGSGLLINVIHSLGFKDAPFTCILMVA